MVSDEQLSPINCDSLLMDKRSGNIYTGVAIVKNEYEITFQESQNVLQNHDLMKLILMYLKLLYVLVLLVSLGLAIVILLGASKIFGIFYLLYAGFGLWQLIGIKCAFIKDRNVFDGTIAKSANSVVVQHDTVDFKIIKYLDSKLFAIIKSKYRLDSWIHQIDIIIPEFVGKLLLPFCGYTMIPFLVFSLWIQEKYRINLSDNFLYGICITVLIGILIYFGFWLNKRNNLRIQKQILASVMAD